MSKTTPSLPFNLWVDSLGEAFKSLSSLWWRFGVVGFCTIALMLLSASLLGGLGYLYFGSISGFESFWVNIELGVFNDTTGIIVVSLLFLLLLKLVIIISANSQVANFLIVKHHRAKKKTSPSPFQLFFVDAWPYLGRYLMIMLILFWRVFWRLLVLGVVMAVIALLLYLLSAQAGVIPDSVLTPVSITVQVIGFVVGFALAIWLLIRYFFAYLFLVRMDCSAAEALDKSEEVVRGNWWKILFFLLLFGLVSGIASTVFNMLNIAFTGLALLPLLEGLDGFIGGFVGVFIQYLIEYAWQFFLIVPITVYFYYELSDRIATCKKIKFK